jgi:hypothetical protein
MKTLSEREGDWRICTCVWSVCVYAIGESARVYGVMCACLCVCDRIICTCVSMYGVRMYLDNLHV